MPPPASVDDSAKNAFHSNPENTIFDVKWLIGRRMDDDDIKKDMKLAIQGHQKERKALHCCQTQGH